MQSSLDKASYVVEINREAVANVLESVLCRESQSLPFIFDAIPTLESFSMGIRMRVVEAFRIFHFKPGVVLLEEGKIPELVYLIASGDVKLIAEYNPLHYVPEKGKQTEDGSELQFKKGAIGTFCRSTINSLITLLSNGSWLGEEAMYYSLPLRYTAVASSNVEAIGLTAEEFNSLIPEEAL